MSEAREIRPMLGDASKDQSAQPRVLGSLDDHAGDFESAIKRSMPVLMRKGIAVEPSPAKLAKCGELLAELKEPYFHIPLATDPGGARAMIVFEAGAVAFLLDAALGGSLEEETMPEVEELTAAQKAAVGRLAEPMVKLISDAMFGLGVRLRRLPAASGVPTEGEFAALTFALAGNNERRIMIAVMRDALSSAGAGIFPSHRKSDAEARVPAILCQVEVDVVAELGRVRKRLADIDGFRVGDVIRLDTPLRSPVLLRVQGRPILRGRPTTSGTQLAIGILDRLEQRPAPAPTPALSERPREVEVALIE